MTEKDPYQPFEEIHETESSSHQHKSKEGAEARLGSAAIEKIKLCDTDSLLTSEESAELYFDLSDMVHRRRSGTAVDYVSREIINSDHQAQLE